MRRSHGLVVGAGARLLRVSMAGVLTLSLAGTPAFAAAGDAAAGITPAATAATGTETGAGVEAATGTETGVATATEVEAATETAAATATVTAAETAAVASAADGACLIGAAADLPQTIEAGQTYKLTADIALSEGQQVTDIAGVLDGCGHTITLSGKPLAASVSGTVQNLGVVSSGTIESSDNLGSIAVSLTGTIRMCWSTASLKLLGWMGEVGGLVGEISGGTLTNSYFAGSIDAMMSGGLVGTGSSGTVANCLFTVGDGAVSMGYGSLAKVNCQKVSESDLSAASALDVLSASIPDTGFSWVSNGSFPQLKDASAPVVVDKSALAAAIAAAEQLSEDAYDSDSWQAFAGALVAAKQVNNDEDATQQQVNDAVRALSEAQNALVGKKPTMPTEIPATAKHIKSQDDFMYMNVKDESAYYVLDNDIVIDDEWFFGPSGELACTFNGQGHSVTFANAGGVRSLFDGVAATGVIENVQFAGELKQATDGRAFGPLGNSVSGAVINCSTSVSGKGVVGFARTLAGGVVSNCYSVAEATGGALFAAYESGRVLNTYWLSYQAQPAQFAASALSNSFSLDPKDMRTAGFVELMNANRGAKGSMWTQGSDGYPHFGEACEYTEPDDETKADVYAVKFIANDGSVQAIGENHVLEVSPDDVAADRLIGSLSLEGVPADSSVTWATSDSNRNNIGVNETTGQLYVYGNAAGTVTATETTADGMCRTVATIKVQAKAQPIDDFQIWFDGTNVTGGAITVSGSEVRNLEVRVHYVGSAEDSFVPVSFTRFSFTGSDASILYSNDYSACFYCKQLGSAAISVTSRDNADLGSKTVMVSSSKVDATSVSLGYAEDGAAIVLHGRNPLSDGAKAFVTDKAQPHVTPDNATNRDHYTVESSNPSVAVYTTSGDIGFTPYAAGATTFTVTLPDIDERTGENISASRNVTYEYANPLASVKAPENVTVKAGAQEKLDLAFAGVNDAQGWSVTEPGMIWSYSVDGIVSIDRDVAGAWKHEEGASDDGLFIASSDYSITALKPGTVTVTGTPIDTTGGARPVTFTVTVDGIAVPSDASDLVDRGIASAAAYLDANRFASAFQYGDEWELYAFANAGREIDQTMVNRYLESVAANAGTWSKSITDTERVMLALASLGEDETDVAGLNLVEVLCGKSNAYDLSNEVAYALLALDRVKAQVPEGSAWDRDALVAKLLTFQNEDGGFGLKAGAGSGIDMTAIALQALAPYADENADAVSDALEYLRGKMSSGTCDFGSAESDAQVLMALVALGKDPLNTANGFANEANNLITALMRYNVEPMGFAHEKEEDASSMPSIQVLQALSAYKAADEGGKGYSWGSKVNPGSGTADADKGGSDNDGNKDDAGNVVVSDGKDDSSSASSSVGKATSSSSPATGDPLQLERLLACIACLAGALGATAAARGAARRKGMRR